MDNRILLPPGYKIKFPGMECEIEKVIGKGSNGIVYICRYNDALNADRFHRVLIKELFPYHSKNLIYRSENGQIVIEKEAEDYYNLQKLSFEKGNSIHLHMLEMHPDKIGANINTFSLNNTFYSIMGFDGGRSLDKEFSQGADSLKHAANILYEILTALEAFHSSGYLHLDISPDNIIITGDAENKRISLIDFNSVHAINDIKNGNTAYCSAKEGYTSPEVINSDMEKVNEASDLYSVTAVFYRLITGKNLTLLQRLSKKPPVAPKNKLTSDMSETVLWQLSLILNKGLASLSSKRYHNCAEMKKDIVELINRIDGIGITHASLWESGKRNLREMINSNPSLTYLNDKTGLYPLRITNSDNTSTDIISAVSNCLTNGNMLLTGFGGMGKTTALLHTAVTLSATYSPYTPVSVYVSLYNFNNSGNNYIKNRILENLHFDKNTSGFEDARNQLISVFNEPLTIKGKENPAYLLLLDGINEASGDITPLLHEIEHLATLKGVRIIITSRTELNTPGFRIATMSPLSETDIKDTLSKYSLLYPESPEIRDILTIPLMLSVFCKTASNNQKQIICKSADELLDEFLNGICEKECRILPENDNQKWCIKAAIFLVLPFICAYESKKNTAISDEALLKIVRRCYRILSNNRIRSLFPSWIGHTKDIKNGTKTAEEWYGIIVLDILWQKTGLLIKDNNGYRVMHQRISEHLLDSYKTINKKISIFNTILASSVSVSTACLIIFIISLIRPTPYDENLARQYMDNLIVGLSYNGSEISMMKEVIVAHNNNDPLFDIYKQNLLNSLSLHSSVIQNGFSGSLQVSDNIMTKMRETGKVFPWSYDYIDDSSVQGLYELGNELTEEYLLYLNVLEYINSDESLKNQWADIFIDALTEKIETDAALCDALFYQIFYPHLNEMKNKAPEIYSYYESVISANGDLSTRDSDSPDKNEIGKLEQERDNAKYALESLPIFTEYRRNTN